VRNFLPLKREENKNTSVGARTLPRRIENILGVILSQSRVLGLSEISRWFFSLFFPQKRRNNLSSLEQCGATMAINVPLNLGVNATFNSV